ncbi:chemotaxis protein CheW [Massilia forsythiae]|uniref:Chemotaxis protein CheW n=1 Tax=Massilia forsythiae TaxID=2728020 RepID=A0A7Z2VZE5_9BURK|nr:chemotaxis protein CheW [Massilia forsythiae]QJE01920.1 chemotaxis protein CheW [Massilia forsythiae]
MNAPLTAAGAVAGYAAAPEVRRAAAALDAARAAAARVLSDAAGMELFGTFLLDGQEFALPAASIREVVGLPDRIMPIPLSPPCLEGIFTLRGAAIPVLNLARIFDAQAPGPRPDQRIAILDHDDVQVGLLFDATGEVLRVRPEQRSSVHYTPAPAEVDMRDAGPGAGGVICGALLLNDGARLVQVLDAAALVRVDNVPQVRSLGAAARSAERARFLRQAEGHKCIAFGAGGLGFALPMLAVQEILRVPELNASVMFGTLCKGWINLRGSAVGVVDFGALLQCAPRTPDDAAAAEARRIVVVRVGEERLGLLVDSVDDVRAYFDSDILPVPMLGTRRAAMFRGCLPHAERGDLLFLSHERIFSEGEAAEICAGHRRLYQQQALDAARQAARGAAAARRRVYLAFSVDAPWAADIGQVREIVAHGAPLVRAPGMPAFVHGMVQLRQQMICVIDLRTLYGMAPLEAQAGETTAGEPAAGEPGAERRVLVLEHEGECYGVVVDRVDSLLTLPDSQRRPAPRLARTGDPAADMRRDLDEVLEVPGEHGTDTVVSLFDKTRFFATLRARLDE